MKPTALYLYSIVVSIAHCNELSYLDSLRGNYSSKACHHCRSWTEVDLLNAPCLKVQHLAHSAEKK